MFYKRIIRSVILVTYPNLTKFLVSLPAVSLLKGIIASTQCNHYQELKEHAFSQSKLFLRVIGLYLYLPNMSMKSMYADGCTLAYLPAMRTVVLYLFSFVKTFADVNCLARHFPFTLKGFSFFVQRLKIS